MNKTIKLKNRVILEGNNLVKYNEILCKFLEEGEGRFKEAYDDYYGKTIRELRTLNKKPIGNITIGIGYNMKNGDSDWNDAFTNEPENKKPNFEKAKNGEVMLTDEQIDKLLVGCIERRRGDLVRAKLYKSQWQYLEPNEKLAIEDLYFNGDEALVGMTNKKDKEGNKILTNFCTNIKLYIAAKRDKDMELANLHFEVCLWEVKYNSNPEKQHPSIRRGLQNRRDSEAIMLNTYDIPILKERNAAFLKKEIEALHKKREAKRMDGSNTSDSNAEFLQQVSRFIEGFIINIKGYLKQETGKENFLTEADISVVRGRMQVYLMAQSVSNQDLINIDQPILDKIDKSFYPTQKKGQMKSTISIMLMYLSQAREIGVQNIAG